MATTIPRADFRKTIRMLNASESEVIFSLRIFDADERFTVAPGATVDIPQCFARARCTKHAVTDEKCAERCTLLASAMEMLAPQMLIWPEGQPKPLRPKIVDTSAGKRVDGTELRALRLASVTMIAPVFKREKAAPEKPEKSGSKAAEIPST